MKNKSLEFVKKSIESGMHKNVKTDDFDTMKEIEFIHFLKSFFKLNEEIIRFDDGILKYSHELKGGGLINASIVHDEDGDFQYFIAEEYICDGTTSFHFSLYEEILDRLYYLKTFLKKSAPKDLEANTWKYDIKYTVGNFVICSKISDEFATKEKPWLKERVTVMLPIRSEFIENIQIKVYHTDVSEEMKEIQLKAMRKVQEKIKKCEPTNSKDIVWNTFGRNNWRKMHGFPLMRGEVEKLGRKIHRQYRG